MKLNKDRILEFISNKKNIFIGIFVIIFVFSVCLVFSFNRGTYSTDGEENTDGISITCPEQALPGEQIECSIVLDAITIGVNGISAKYNVTEGMEYVGFTANSLWSSYDDVNFSDEEGFFLVSDGLTGNVSVGVVKYNIPIDALSNEIYMIELVDVTIGDGEDTTIELGNVSDQIRVISDINTLDSLILSNGQLNETFDKNLNNYTANIDSDKVSVEIVKTDNEHSSVAGDIGELDIHYGTNNFKIVVTSESGKERVYTLNVYRDYKFTSDIYKYSEENKYIYIGSNKENQTLLDSFNLPTELRGKIENNKLIISYGDEILKEYSLISVKPDIYDLGKGYIYTSGSVFDANKIDVINALKEVIDNKLVIKYNDTILEEYVIVSINSEEYDLNKDYIYVGNGSFDVNKIGITNCSKEVVDNKLVIKYNDILLEEYVIIKFNTDMNIIGKYMYVGNLTDSEILSNISVTNGIGIIDNNNVQIKYNEELVDVYKLVRVSSASLMILEDNKLYIANKTNDQIKNELILVNASVNVTDDKVEILVNNEVINTFSKLFISFASIDVIDKTISFAELITYDKFVANITNSADITYKLFNNNVEVSTGNVIDGSILKVYYGDSLIDNYTVSVYNLSFDKDITIDEENKYVKYLKIGTTVSSLLDKINVVGNNVDVAIYSDTNYKNRKSNSDIVGSGDILAIIINDEIMNEYKLSVTGDANGDGKIDLIDLVQMRKHIVGWLNPQTNLVYEKTGVYLEAIDMNKDGIIDLIDLVRIRKTIVGLI